MIVKQNLRVTNSSFSPHLLAAGALAKGGRGVWSWIGAFARRKEIHRKNETYHEATQGSWE